MKKLLLISLFCLMQLFGYAQAIPQAQVDIHASENKDALQIYDSNENIKLIINSDGVLYMKGSDLSKVIPQQGMIAVDQVTGKLMTFDNGNWIALVQDIPVTRVNGKTGDVILSYSDVGAEPAFIKNDGFNKKIGTTPGTILEGSWRPTWDDVLDKPSKFPPSAHTHTDYVALENGFDVNTGAKLTSIAGSISHQSNSENNYGGLLPSSFGSSWLFNSNTGRDFAFYKDATSEDLYVGFDNPTSGQFEFKKLLHEDNLEIAKPTWNDIINKPTTFNPSVHQHDASEISSGILSYDRLPFSSTSVSDWNKAFSWGNHSNAGYLYNTTDQLTGDLTVTNNVITSALKSPNRFMVSESGDNLYLGDYNGGTTSVSLRAKNDPTFYNGSLHTIWHSGNFIKGNYLRRNINDTFSGQFMRFDHSSNHGIVTGSDSQRLLIGGGSNWNGNNGAYISLEGNNYGGAGAGKDIHLLPGSGGGIVNVGTSLTVNSNITANTITAKGGGNNIRLNGSGTGLSNVAYASFFESNGSKRQGYIGFPSASSGHLILHNDLGSNQIILNQNGGENGLQYYQGSNTRTVYHSGNHKSDTEMDNAYFPREAGVSRDDANNFILDGYVNARPWAAHSPPNGHGTTFGFGEKASGFRQIHVSDNGNMAVRALNYNNTTWSPWRTIWNDGNDGHASGLDADKTDGYHASQGASGETLAVRNSAGDINARLFRSEYGTTNPNIGYIMTQVNTADNNFIRPSTRGQFRNAVTDGHYIKRNERTDGFAWLRYGSTNPPLWVTQQSTGNIASFRQGSGDGVEVATIENDGTYRTHGTGGLDISGTSKFHTVYNVASNNAIQRSDARPESSTARLHLYGLTTDNKTSNFKEAWYDGNSYVNVTGENNGITFGGSLKATSFIGKATDSDKLDGLNSNLFMRAHTANGYFGLAAPGNNTTNWIRTTSNGLLPYASNGTNGTSSLGTSSWPFANIYGKNIYGRFHGTANNANTLGGQNTAFFRNASNLNAGTVNYNRLPIGTSSTTVAVGNHTHSNYVPTSRTITGGEHISGGGNLGGNRTFNLRPDVNTWITDSQGKQRMYFYASASNGGGIILRASGTTGQLQYRNSGNSTMFSVDSNGTVRASGDVIAGSSSDKRLKDSIVPISNPLGKIQKLSGNSYKWNDKQTAYKTGTKDYGVIAQEVKEVLPNAVKLRETTGYYEVDYKDLIPLLIEAVKAQQKEIETLKALNEEYGKGKEKIKDLEAELEMIKKKLGL